MSNEANEALCTGEFQTGTAIKYTWDCTHKGETVSCSETEGTACVTNYCTCGSSENTCNTGSPGSEATTNPSCPSGKVGTRVVKSWTCDSTTCAAKECSKETSNTCTTPAACGTSRNTCKSGTYTSHTTNDFSP